MSSMDCITDPRAAVRAIVSPLVPRVVTRRELGGMISALGWGASLVDHRSLARALDEAAAVCALLSCWSR